MIPSRKRSTGALFARNVSRETFFIFLNALPDLCDCVILVGFGYVALHLSPCNFTQLSHFSCENLLQSNMKHSMNIPTQNPFAIASAPEAPAPNSAPNQADDRPPASSAQGQVTGLGQWVFNHRASFSKQNPVAWYGVRNVMSNMAGIAGLITVIVGVRKGMGHGAQWAEKNGHQFLSNELSRTYTQNALGVGLSFATFRTIYKTCQRAYDSLFIKPQNAEQASDAVSNLPKKLWSDFKQIGVVEYPVTTIGGFVLVGIRGSIAGEFPKESAAKTKYLDILKDKHTQRDIAGCAFFAYPAFFEIIEHMGGAWQKKRGYTDKDHNEHVNKDQQGMKETFFRQIPAVAAGIFPYIATNTWAIRNMGRQHSYNTNQRAAGIKEIDSFTKGYYKEMPYQYFWMYSLGRDLYYDAYDKLTGKAQEPGAHAALPNMQGGHGNKPLTERPTAKVVHIDAQGRTQAPTAAVAV